MFDARFTPSLPASVHDAANRILSRRETVEDPDLVAISDDPMDLVVYVQHHRRVPVEILLKDLADALVILTQYKQRILLATERLQLDVVELICNPAPNVRGWKLREVGKLMEEQGEGKLSSRQAMKNWSTRTRHAVEVGGVRSEKAARLYRLDKLRSEHQQQREVTAAAVKFPIPPIRSVVEQIMMSRHVFGDRELWIDDVIPMFDEQSSTQPTMTPALLIWLREAFDELWRYMPEDSSVEPMVRQFGELLTDPSSRSTA